MFAISIGFTITGAAMWAVAVGLTVTHRAVMPMSLDRAGAVAMTVLAGLCWLEHRREMQRERRDGERAREIAEYKRREQVLILALNSLADAPTGPLQRLHAI